MSDDDKYFRALVSLLLIAAAVPLSLWGGFTLMASHYGWLNNFSGGCWAYGIGMVLMLVAEIGTSK